MPDTSKKVGDINFTPELLTRTFQTFRKELIVQPMLAMSELTKHTSIRTGIRYRDTVTEMSGDFQIGNFKKDKESKANLDFEGRVFETFKGNCIETIDPVSIYQTIWGTNVNNGEALKNVPYVVQVCGYIMKKLGENLLMNVFTAKHDGTNYDETAKFFNGFKTIIDNDIAGKNENQKVYISEDKGNLVYLDSLVNGFTAIDETNAEDILKKFYFNKNLSPKLRGRQLKMFISDMTYHYYTEAYQTRHGALPYNQAYDKKTLEGATNVELVPLSCVPDDFILLTPKSNIFCIYNQKTDDETYRVEQSKKNHYDQDFIADTYFGTQFESVSPEVFAVAEKNAAA